MMTGQSSKIRIRWNSTTKVKIIPATIKYVFRSMSVYPKRRSQPYCILASAIINAQTSDLLAHPVFSRGESMTLREI